MKTRHEASARSLQRMRHVIAAGGQQWTADTTPPAGEGSGPGPFDILCAALAACASMTVKMYAERKGWPLSGIEVTVSHERDEKEQIDRFEKLLRLQGPLDEAQRARLLEISGKCPVHRSITGQARIVDTLAP